MAVVEGIPWEQRHMPERWVDGQNQSTPMPRLEWLASTLPGRSYTYSGVRYDAADLHPWPAIVEVMARASIAAGVEFNAVFANMYRDGDDSIGWHSDDEPVLGPTDQAVIASVSLGARRRFLMREVGRTTNRHEYDIGEGDLLIMHAGCQSRWEHCAPKTAKPVGPRVSLTFRALK